MAVTARERRERAEIRRLAKALVWGGDFEVRRAAAQKLKEMGPEAPGWVEALREAMYKGQAGLGWGAVMAAEALARHATCIEAVARTMLRLLRAALARDDRVQADIIVLVLQVAGSRAADRMDIYLGRMAEFLPDPRVSGRMAEAFRLIYRRTPTAYREMLKAYREAAGDPETQDRAAALRGLLEEVRAEAEARTIGATSEDPAERAATAARLGATGCASNLVLRTLLWLTGDPDASVRAAAHGALAMMGVDEEYNREMMDGGCSVFNF